MHPVNHDTNEKGKVTSQPVEEKQLRRLLEERDLAREQRNNSLDHETTQDDGSGRQTNTHEIHKQRPSSSLLSIYTRQHREDSVFLTVPLSTHR